MLRRGRGIKIKIEDVEPLDPSGPWRPIARALYGCRDRTNNADIRRTSPQFVTAFCELVFFHNVGCISDKKESENVLQTSTEGDLPAMTSRHIATSSPDTGSEFESNEQEMLDVI